MAKGLLDAAQAWKIQIRAPHAQPSLAADTHRVREAAGLRRMTVMQRAGLDQDRPAGHARVQGPMALKALHALLGVADQHVVVVVRIISVASEMRASDRCARRTRWCQRTWYSIRPNPASGRTTSCHQRMYCAPFFPLGTSPVLLPT